MGLLDGILSRMRRARPSPVAAARVGALVTLRGEVVPRDLIHSPLTGDPCVYYRYTREAWRRSRIAGIAGGAAGDGFWELVETDAAIVEFYLDDGTGRAIVSPGGARVEPARRVGTQTMQLANGQRGQQVLIVPGDRIAVTGVMARADDLFDDRRSYREAADRALIRAPEGGTLRIRVMSRG